MASKSRFLEDLINNRLNPETNIVDALWSNGVDIEYNIMTPSIVDNLTSDASVITNSGSTWLNALGVFQKNTNKTVTDTTLTTLNQVTTDRNAIPTTRQFVKKQYTFNTLPPSHLVCTLTANHGGTITEIPVLFPRSLSRSLTASFSKQNPVGSNHAIMAYSHTDSETIPFSFDVLSEYLPSGINSFNDYVDKIMSILKPTYAGSVVKEPRVTFEIADLKFSCVCTSANINYDMLFQSNSFVHATIDVQLTRIEG